MQIKNKTIEKAISSLLIIAILLPAFTIFATPRKTEAQFHDVITGIWTGLTAVFTGTGATSEATQAAISVKNVAKEITKQVIGTIVRKALQELTKSTINWINTGNFGNPLFLENPKSFFKDIAKTEIKTFIELTGYDPLRFPFGKQYALNTIDAYKRGFANNAQYTLSEVFKDPVLLQKYRNDFNVGGWNGLIVNSQYPQNNIVTYNMIATDELAHNLAGTATNAATEVQKKLDQGSGFLSPQICADKNTQYNNLTNPFKKPSFDERDYAKKNPEPHPNDYDDADAFGEAQMAWSMAHDIEKAKWAETNTCKNLVNSTPGTVIASQITNAMGSNFRQSELGAALGVSLSAVFDALTNKLMDKGLTALTSKINPASVDDNFSYYGNTLGSAVTGGNNYSWDSGPDEEISVDGFKKQLRGKSIIKDENGAVVKEEVGDTGNGEYVPGDIANTELELKLMDNENPKDPGVTQLIGQIWPKIRELDMCLPGPDLGWEDRLIEEQNRNSQKLQEKTQDNNGDKASEAQLNFKSLQFAVNYFKDWVNTKIMGSLPGAIIYQDTVKAIAPIYQENKQLTDKRRARAQALARLKAIDLNLNNFTTQPETGTQKEKDLVSVRKQYNATKDDISNSGKIEDTRNQLSVNKDRLANLRKLVTQCLKERTTMGWANPGGIGSVYNPPMTQTISTTIPTTTPTSTKDVTQTNEDGWYPKISANGRYVAYGNLRAYNIDLETNTKKDLTPAGESRCWGGDWISGDTVSFTCEINGSGMNRYEYKVGEWIAKKTSDNPNLVAGNSGSVADGHWASWLATGNRIALDNKVYASGDVWDPIVSKNQMIYGCESTEDTNKICLATDGVQTNVYTPVTTVFAKTLNNGYILYQGYDGSIHGINPQGEDTDLTVSPWGREGVGQIIFVNNQPWVITVSYDPSDKGYLFIRPWGEYNVIALTTDGGYPDIAYVNGSFVIATNTTQGKQTIKRVPANTPRKNLGAVSAANSLSADKPGTEFEIFCARPIIGGYQHEAFRTPNISGNLQAITKLMPFVNTYKNLPLVNAKEIQKWRSAWGTILTLGLGGQRKIDIEINCNIVFKANVLDYKQDLPGNTIPETYEDLDAGGGGFTCETCAEKNQTDPYQNDVRVAAREYLAAHPEIADLPSYNAADGGSDEGEAAVARLRDGTIAILKTKGFNATTSGNPPYPQVVTVWKNGDADKSVYRVAAGGGKIRDAIEAGYCGGHESMAGEDIIPMSCLVPGGEEEGAPAPADAGTKHGNQTSYVESAKNALVALGRTWVPGQPNDAEYECKRFEITNRAAKLIPGAGLLEKSGGTNCRGYSVDIIAFSDGYIYDVLDGTSADGARPTWGPKGCGPATGNGTCPDKYKPTISYP